MKELPNPGGKKDTTFTNQTGNEPTDRQRDPREDIRNLLKRSKGPQIPKRGVDGVSLVKRLEQICGTEQLPQDASGTKNDFAQGERERRERHEIGEESLSYNAEYRDIHGTEVVEHLSLQSISNALRREEVEGEVFTYQFENIMVDFLSAMGGSDETPLQQYVYFVNTNGKIHAYAEFLGEEDLREAEDKIQGPIKSRNLSHRDGIFRIGLDDGDIYRIYKTQEDGIVFDVDPEASLQQMEVWLHDVQKAHQAHPKAGILQFSNHESMTRNHEGITIADYTVGNVHLITYLQSPDEMNAMDIVKQNLPGIRLQDNNAVLEWAIKLKSAGWDSNIYQFGSLQSWGKNVAQARTKHPHKGFIRVSKDPDLISSEREILMDYIVDKHHYVTRFEEPEGVDPLDIVRQGLPGIQIEEHDAVFRWKRGFMGETPGRKRVFRRRGGKSQWVWE